MDVRLPDGRVIQNIPEGTTKAQIMARLQRAEAPNPTDGMSGTERAAAEFGSLLPRLGRGIGQVYDQAADAVSPVDRTLSDVVADRDPSRLAKSQAEEVEMRRLEQPLNDTRGGKVGAFLRDAIGTTPGFIAGGIPGGIANSALYYGLQPTVAGESKLMNAGKGALSAAVGAGGVKLAGGAYRLGKSALAPFFANGQKNIAAEVLQRMASDPAALRQATSAEIVPGSLPKLSEATSDAGIARLEKVVAASDNKAKQEFAAREVDQNAARLAAIEKHAGDKDSIIAAQGARDAAALPMLNKAKQAAGIDVAPVKQVIEKMLAGEAGQRTAVAGPLRDVLAKFDGLDDVERLYGVRKHIGDLMAGKVSGQEGAATAARSELVKIKEALDSQISAVVPEWGQYLATYAEKSKPIDQMKILQELLKRSTGNLDDALGNKTIQANKLGAALKADANVVKAATNFKQSGGLQASLTPEQMAALQAVNSDLSRQGVAQGLAAAKGSDTFQNLIGGNLMRSASQGMLGQRLGGIAAETQPVAALSKLISKAYNLTGVEDSTRQALVRMLLHPDEAASAVKGLSVAQRSALSDALAKTAGISASASSAPTK